MKTLLIIVGIPVRLVVAVPFLVAACLYCLVNPSAYESKGFTNLCHWVVFAEPLLKSKT